MQASTKREYVQGPEPMLVPLDRRNELQPTDWLRRFNPAYSKWGRPREVVDKAIMKELLTIEDQKVRAFLARACGVGAGRSARSEVGWGGMGRGGAGRGAGVGGGVGWGGVGEEEDHTSPQGWASHSAHRTSRFAFRKSPPCPRSVTCFDAV